MKLLTRRRRARAFRQRQLDHRAEILKRDESARASGRILALAISLDAEYRLGRAAELHSVRADILAGVVGPDGGFDADAARHALVGRARLKLAPKSAA